MATKLTRVTLCLINYTLLISLKIIRFHNYPLHFIGNMDEMPLNFDMPPNRTVNNTTENFKIRATGNEQNGTTVLLACSGDGSKLRPMVIFKRKTPSTELSALPKRKAGWMPKE